MDRRLEPEAMDSNQEAEQYDRMDFTEANTAFAERAVELCPDEGLILDLGTGTARIPILMSERAPMLFFIAIDLAKSMLNLGAMNVTGADMNGKIALMESDAKSTGFPDDHFDAVVCNSLIHHVPRPVDVFREIARVAKPGAAILVRDLVRPETEEQLNRLLDTHASDCTDIQRKLLADSLRSSLSVAEIRAAVTEAGIVAANIEKISDRHWSLEREAISYKENRSRK